MKNKKYFLIGIILVVVLVILGVITSYIDSSRVTTNHEPKFCIKTISQDGSKVTYWGLGYKIIRYVGVSPKEPYENNIGAKMGNWFMKYEPPIDNNKAENIKNKISNLDEFYNTEITKNLDIRTLGIDYNIFDAQKDNCFVVGAMVHNDYLYSEFMNDVKNKKTSFIRVAQDTMEGDLILIDILYYDKADEFYLVIDSTRDKYAEERKIELKEFMNIGTYHFDNHLYWVLYNDSINDENFNTEEVFKILTIN